MKFRRLAAVSYMCIPVFIYQTIVSSDFASYCHHSLHLPTQFNSYLSVVGVQVGMNSIRGTNS